MSNVVPQQNDEIDLFAFFETLWAGKWPILATTFVAAVIGVTFYVVTPNAYAVSTPIQSGKQSDFLNYIPLNNLLMNEGLLHDSAKNPNGYVIDSASIFKIFVAEFNDYEEMVDAVSTSEFVKTSIKDMGGNNKKKALINFAKSFELKGPSKKKHHWTLSFEWHDDLEGARLLNDAIRQTLSNIKNSTKANVIELAEIIDFQNTQKLENLRHELSIISQNQINADKKRIQYLMEQSAIAKELGIETNELNVKALSNPSQNAISFNLDLNELPFYLRGYRAIDKEISILQNRALEETLLAADRYLAIKEEILLLENDLSSSHLRGALEIIETDDANNWIEFDLKLADFKSQKNPLLYVTLSIVLGGMIGILFVVISNAIRKRKEQVAIA